MLPTTDTSLALQDNGDVDDLRFVEIMDTTLRDGEQTSGVSFSVKEKFEIARLLLGKLNVNRIEVASARVSNGEFEAVKQIAEWAAENDCIERVEVLGFLDGTTSLDWLVNTGCRTMNLLTKGSINHLINQLRKTPDQHISEIKQLLKEADKRGISINIYLEDWSNGMLHSPDYVYLMLDSLKDLPIKRFMLPDTLGVLNPFQVYEFFKNITEKYPDLHFDFHAHNDYDLASANVLAAVKAGAKGVHTTINGLGERAGNAPLSSVLAVLHDQLHVQTTVEEKQLYAASRVLETYSGIRVSANCPVIGDHVFTQCAGIHADGDKKNNLYYNDLLPERFGRTREYALGKTSGKANIAKNLEQLGITLDDEMMRKLTEHVVELGDKKELVTPEDLPYIIADILNINDNDAIKVTNYALSSAYGMRPVASLKIEIEGNQYEESSVGDGQYDAFMRALRKIYESLNIVLPKLFDYSVSIPPGGRTDALVQTIITWDIGGRMVRTKGLDSDQTVAAIKATIKMLNTLKNQQLQSEVKKISNI